MLPRQAAPLLIFMGVTAEGGDAVFLVDSTLQAAGEGRCKPSPSDCAFAYIGAGSEHVFTEEDGDSYALRIDEIRKVKVPAQGRGRPGRQGLRRPRRRPRWARHAASSCPWSPTSWSSNTDSR